jgi:hypothetical protein
MLFNDSSNLGPMPTIFFKSSFASAFDSPTIESKVLIPSDLSSSLDSDSSVASFLAGLAVLVVLVAFASFSSVSFTGFSSAVSAFCF